MIKAVVFSLGTNRKGVFYANAIVKIGKQIKQNVIFRIDMTTISVTDPLSDMVFGSALGHLYDIGVCPFVTKYFGTYHCDDNQTAMIIEAADKELYKVLDRSRMGFITPTELKRILGQYLYCLFILKYYYGAVHYDSHLRNLMLTDIPSHPDIMYHGKKLSDIKYILFETNLLAEDKSPILVAMHRSRYMLKVIDYGCMSVYFDRSKVAKFRRDMRIESSMSDIELIGAKQALVESRLSESYANTVDFMFTLINIYYYMKLELDHYQGYAKFDEHLKVVNDVMRVFSGTSMDDFLVMNPQYKVNVVNENYDWFMRNHSTGIRNGYSNPKLLLNTLALMCDKRIPNVDATNLESVTYNGTMVTLYLIDSDINYKEMTVANTLMLTHNPHEYQLMYNRMNSIIDNRDKCLAGKAIYCKIEQLTDQKPAEIYQSLYTVSNNSKYKLLVKENPFETNVPRYKNYTSWLNKIPIPKDRIGSTIENIRVHLLSIKSFSDCSIRTNDPLVDTKGLTVPIGIQQSNRKKNALPAGFYIHNNTLVGAPLPADAEKYICVMSYIQVQDSRLISLETYSQFMARHDSTGMEVDNVLQIPALPVRSGTAYKWAITVGPVLVWNSNIVFNEKAASMVPDTYVLQSHIVYIQSRRHHGFIFVEGGGFLSQGLDRLDLARLCLNLGAVKAVCVGSGMAANGIVFNPDDPTSSPKYILKSPIRIRHSAVIDFEWGI
jgi:hypothetical protein